MGTEQLLEAQRWRYAVKVFDPARKIPADTWSAIEQALILSPSSFGLQPYKFLVLTDPKLRQELVPCSWKQKQIVDCSHFVVFAAKDALTASDVERLIARTVEVRRVTPESLSANRSMMMNLLVEGPGSRTAREWSARQAYIALGNLMTSAAVLGIDACPIEGFVPARYDELLNLKGSGFHSVVCCALGYRSTSDTYAAVPKVRFREQELIQRI